MIGSRCKKSTGRNDRQYLSESETPSTYGYTCTSLSRRTPNCGIKERGAMQFPKAIKIAKEG